MEQISSTKLCTNQSVHILHTIIFFPAQLILFGLINLLKSSEHNEDLNNYYSNPILFG